MIVKYADVDTDLSDSGHNVIVAMENVRDVQLLWATLYLARKVMGPPDEGFEDVVMGWIETLDSFITEEADNA